MAKELKASRSGDLRRKADDLDDFIHKVTCFFPTLFEFYLFIYLLLNSSLFYTCSSYEPPRTLINILQELCLSRQRVHRRVRSHSCMDTYFLF